MELLFVVAKIMGHLAKMIAYFFIQIVLSVIMTTTIQNTVAFGNARITL